jgi:hypothetical protein
VDVSVEVVVEVEPDVDLCLVLVSSVVFFVFLVFLVSSAVEVVESHEVVGGSVFLCLVVLSFLFSVGVDESPADEVLFEANVLVCFPVSFAPCEGGDDVSEVSVFLGFLVFFVVVSADVVDFPTVSGPSVFFDFFELVSVAVVDFDGEPGEAVFSGLWVFLWVSDVQVESQSVSATIRAARPLGSTPAPSPFSFELVFPFNRGETWLICLRKISESAGQKKCYGDRRR